VAAGACGGLLHGHQGGYGRILHRRRLAGPEQSGQLGALVGCHLPHRVEDGYAKRAHRDAATWPAFFVVPTLVCVIAEQR
jgi:hypothetical protein